ncbi:hypothetical protein [Vibrio sp. A1-1]|uniref:hypothetical protein n=1 Tax=Vibrio sp. A1-1 TaxID=2912250 RepID=UPI001F21CD48|nr:hypothetical protein [Vibrio sp. A1-1]MCF7454859.1 hypothetical protein [Vibrio sp. A1-1]
MDKNVVITLLSLFSSVTFASEKFEASLFNNVSQSIDNYGAKIKLCESMADQNTPDKQTLEYSKKHIEALTPVLPFLSEKAFEACVLKEKQELAYYLLIAKNNASRTSTLKLVESTESLTFHIEPTSREKFETLSKVHQEYIEKSPFFSRPFDALAFYEKLIQ